MARKLKLDATLMNPTDKKWSLAQSISREESMSFVRPIDYLSFSYIIVLYILDNEMILQNIGWDFGDEFKKEKKILIMLINP